MSASWCTGLLQGDREKTEAGKAKGQLWGWEGAQGRISLSGLAAGPVAAAPTAQGGQRELEQGQGGAGQDKNHPQKLQMCATAGDGQQEGTGGQGQSEFSSGGTVLH